MLDTPRFDMLMHHIKMLPSIEFLRTSLSEDLRSLLAVCEYTYHRKIVACGIQHLFQYDVADRCKWRMDIRWEVSRVLMETSKILRSSRLPSQREAIRNQKTFKKWVVAQRRQSRICRRVNRRLANVTTKPKSAAKRLPRHPDMLAITNVESGGAIHPKAKRQRRSGHGIDDAAGEAGISRVPGSAATLRLWSQSAASKEGSKRRRKDGSRKDKSAAAKKQTKNGDRKKNKAQSSRY